MNLAQKFSDLDKQASRNKEKYYIDPLTGNRVMTSYYLLKRGFCCGTGCRHCPYDYDEHED